MRARGSHPGGAIWPGLIIEVKLWGLFGLNWFPYELMDHS